MRLRQLLADRRLALVLIAHLAFAAAALLAFSGLLQPLDLMAYDAGLRARAPAQGRDDRIVLIEAADPDFARLGWPLSDAVLAQALERAAAANPRVIGVDVYRDQPVEPGSDALARVLATRRDVVWVYLFGGVKAPAAIADADQTGFADIVLDPDGFVRRGLLFLDDGKGLPRPSLALALALRYLAAENIRPTSAPDGVSMQLGARALPPFESDDGAYVGADARGYQIPLDFARGPEPFARYSLSALLAGEVPPAALAHRIVLLGIAAQSANDYFAAPVASDVPGTRLAYGRTLHAQLAGELLRLALDGDTLTQGLPLAEKLLAIWLAAMLGMGAAAVGRGALLHAVLGLGGLLGVGGLWYWVLSVHLWAPLAAPALAWILAATLATAYLALRERRERGLLMSLFAAHVSPPLAEEIWRRRSDFMSGGRPTPQRLTATVLFSDIAEFTPITERLGPEGVMAWLEGYMDRMVNTVMAHDGVVLRFIGDAILVAFGVPLPRQAPEEVAQDATRAVLCALAMAEAVHGLNAELGARGLPAIEIRIGIMTGEMVGGSLGADSHLEYALMGDAVNTAARLEALGKSHAAESGLPARILIGEPTHALLRGVFQVTHLGEIELKGKAMPTAVWQVLAREVAT